MGVFTNCIMDSNVIIDCGENIYIRILNFPLRQHKMLQMENYSPINHSATSTFDSLKNLGSGYS